MKQRYWMRVITPPERMDQIWLEARPRWQQDAANFHHVQVILDAKAMVPVALRLYDPNPKVHKVYVFANTKVNGAWDQVKDFFKGPRTPVGWKHGGRGSARGGSAQRSASGQSHGRQSEHAARQPAGSRHR